MARKEDQLTDEVLDALTLAARHIRALRRELSAIRERLRMEQDWRDQLMLGAPVETPPQAGEICPCCKVRKFAWPKHINPENGHLENG